MALEGKIMDFYADKEMTTPAFPRTKVKAISDDDNVGLDALLGDIDTKIADLTEISAPVIDARGAEYDMDAEIVNGNGLTIYNTDANTIGTPKAQGLTTYSRALIFNYSESSNYGFQLCLTGGGARMYQRNMSNGTMTEWKTVLTSVMNSTEYGTSLPAAGTKGRIFFKKA